MVRTLGDPNQENYQYEKGWYISSKTIGFHRDCWPNIRVIGAGVAGCNAIYRMAAAKVDYVDLLAIVPDKEIYERFVDRISAAEIGSGTSVYALNTNPKSLYKADVAIIVADIEDKASMEIIPHITHLAKLNGAVTVAIISHPAANYEAILTRENYYLSPLRLDTHYLDDVNTLVIIAGKTLNDRNIPLADPFWMAEEPVWRTVQCITNFANPLICGLNKENYKFLLTSGNGNAQIGKIGMGFGDGGKAFEDALAMCLKTGMPMPLKKDNKYFVNCILNKSADWKLDFFCEAKQAFLPENSFFEVTLDRRFQHDAYVTMLCLNANIYGEAEI
jgi:cell division GTPase FtsZ